MEKVLKLLPKETINNVIRKRQNEIKIGENINFIISDFTNMFFTG